MKRLFSFLLLFLHIFLSSPAFACTWEIHIYNKATGEDKTYRPRPFGEFLEVDLPYQKDSSWTSCFFRQKETEIAGVGGIAFDISCIDKGGATVDTSCAAFRNREERCFLKLSSMKSASTSKGNHIGVLASCK